MNEDVPICHCAEYYGSHAPDCPIAAEVRALRKDGERLDWLANQSEPSWSLFFSSSWQTSPELRTAIDAAMAREGEA